MTQKAKIHVIGSYAVGMTIKTPSFPGPGETVQGYGFQQFHGGKGSNQAVGAARMGAEVLYTGCIGTDAFGKAALAMYDMEGVVKDTVFTTDECSTGVGLVIVGDSGENEIVIDLGANNMLSNEHIDSAFSSGFAADIMLVQLEANLDAVFYALKMAKQKGIPSVINPAPYRQVSEEFIRLATYITPNQTEAAQLAGCDAEPEKQCRLLKERYAVDVILTVGENGAYYTRDDEVIHCAGFSANPVDTTGAGDCFNAALAVMLAEGKDLGTAIRIANLSASRSVEVDGVLESLPHRTEIDELIKRQQGA